MKETINILMKRDNLSLQEAKDLINETIEEIQDYLEENPGDLSEAEDIWMSNTGLEIDYMLDCML